MLADERNWCHEERTIGLPKRTAELAAGTGLRDGAMKFSYLVLRREPLTLVAAPPAGRSALRVVSHPHRPKGKIEMTGCGEQGLVQLRLLRRHRSAPNRPFERAVRGDVLVLGDANELGRDDQVTRIRPADE